MSTERLSDEQVDAYVGHPGDGSLINGTTVSADAVLLAREVQEWRKNAGVGGAEQRQPRPVTAGDDSAVTPAVPSEFVSPPIEGPHDHKGYSEEKCVRCGWVMGGQALNCMNNDTPHVFPSQLSVAPVGDEPNPYRFTLKVEWSDVALDWMIVLADSHERMFMEWACPTEAEAREHARLIAAALRNVEVE